MMRGSVGKHLLRLVGGLCSVAGFLAWVGLVWRAVSGLDEITAHDEEGSRFMVWALTGTLLMIGGMIVLHFAEVMAEREAREDPPPQH